MGGRTAKKKKGSQDPSDPTELFQRLYDEFRDIDPSLILAVANDLDIVSQFDQIRAILLPIAESAAAEQATGFDPSGLGSAVEDLNLDGNGGNAASGNTRSEPESLTADCATTISENSRSSGSSGDSDQADPTDLESSLKIVFPMFKQHTIRFILKANGNKFDRAFEELLTRQALEEDSILPKGVDGFFVPDEHHRPSKGKGKARRNRTDNAANRLNINYSVVSATVDDAELEGAKGPVKLPTTRLAGSALRRAHSATPAYTGTPGKTPLTKMMNATAGLASGYSGPELAAQANALYRGRMGNLGRQGAIVYSERAKEEKRAAAARASETAEWTVDQQSGSSYIDLHGVNVADGVRIANDRVWRWWNSLEGEEPRSIIAKREGFTVVTGVGKHSSSGVSPLRRAVGITLQNNGWKVEALTGSFLITGRT